MHEFHGHEHHAGHPEENDIEPVTMVDVGYHCFKTGVWSGQPMVENGHRAEENQVSSTSGS